MSGPNWGPYRVIAPILVSTQRRRLGVEAQTQPVQRPKPEITAPIMGVGPGDAAPCHLDPQPARRFRRPRDRPTAHHLQPGALVVPAGQQVQADLGAEPGRTDPQTRVPQNRGDLAPAPPSARCRGGLTRVEVAMAPPQVCVIAPPRSPGKVASMWR